MATAYELDKVKCNPIKERLATFRRLFESTRSDLDVASSSDEVEAVFFSGCHHWYGSASRGYPQLLTHIVAKNLVLDLIQALQVEPAARILPSRIADRTLSGDLATLYSRVDSNQLDITLAIPLVKQIAGKRTDLE
jgi:hypothetical protein